VDDEMRLAAVETCQSRLPRRFRVPLLPIDAQKRHPTREIERWALEHRPEAVIGFNSGIVRNLENAGLRVPEDMAFASLHVDPMDRIPGRTRVSGMQNMTPERIETAIQLLDQQIRQHQYGLDPKARTLMIHSEWMEGGTTPARRTKGHGA
jgi:LacI family transcriptional regulator